MSASDNSPQQAEQQKPQEAATPSYPTQGERIASGAKRDLLPTNYDSEQARILFVHAHPDDETSSTGATMAYYAQKGAEVYLITATRGELGEVIPQQLQHLEVGKPGCTDNGEALGEYRVGELNGALEALGVRRHLFLGQEPATAEGVPALYRDSGMAWGPNGKPIANPVSSDASLTAQPLEPQAQALVAAIHEIQPDVLVTYDADGGYGHPDHVRVHQIVKRALEILGDDEDRPLLTWGIEGEYNPEDTRVQAAIFGDGTAKRKAMEAHRTQITVLDAKTFEYSNKVPQKISAVETYRVLDGDPTRTVNPKPQEAGLVSTALTGVILGTVAAVAGSVYHAWVVYAGDVALPVGLVIAYLTIFFASLWSALALRRGMTAAIVGAVAFVTVYWLAYGRPDSPFVLVNPGHSAIGLYGALWWFGAPVAAMLGMFAYTRNRVKDARYFSARSAHQRARAKVEGRDK